MAVMFEDQLVPDKTLSQILPTNWVDQCQCVQTVELQSSEEWKLCAKMMESMQVRITKITRIQNVVMGRRWECARETGIINEMLLFHGTSGNDPFKVACGEDGLDIQLSKGGSWGQAIYLSESALYADKFAHHNTSDEKEIIIVKALIGESFDYGTERNRSLKMPPIKHAHGKH